MALPWQTGRNKNRPDLAQKLSNTPLDRRLPKNENNVEQLSSYLGMYYSSTYKFNSNETIYNES
jgi:hypothetical protein